MYKIRSHWRRGTAGLIAAVLCTAISVPALSVAVTSATADTNPASTSTDTSTSLPAVVVNPTTPEQSGDPTPTASTDTPSAAAPTAAVSVSTPDGPTLNAAVPAPTGSTTTSDPSSSSETTTDNTTTVHNTVDSTATSGNAAVTDNRKGGDATSGSSTATATVVNSVSSTSGFGNPSGFTYYTKDINAGQDMQGNILIDPGSLTPVNSSGTTHDGIQTTSSLTDITNDITLAATSGNADVSGNRKAGDATTGDATAIANIINIVNSQIGAKQTFLGVINIYGNLTGDIQVPANFVDSLLGSGALGNAATGGNQTVTTNTTIDNNITTSATSGDATVSGNRKAGDATTGNATTNVTVFNLTGQQVIAKNSLLVFVNVLGKWVGVIVNQPAGATNAAFVSGGNSAASVPASGDTTVTSDTHITNNVHVSATSGDASVTGNRKAGNATSGDAKAGVNLLNIANSDFSLDGWFGVLFINVLGSWLGNFGIDTPLPDPVSTGGGDGGQAQTPIKDVKVFRFNNNASFRPSGTAVSSGAGPAIAATPVATVTPDKPQTGGHVLGTSTSHSNAIVSKVDVVAFFAIVVALTLLLMLLSWAGRKVLAARQLRRLAS